MATDAFEDIVQLFVTLLRETNMNMLRIYHIAKQLRFYSLNSERSSKWVSG